jgi:branched-chain amino acid transport system permease protein
VLSVLAATVLAVAAGALLAEYWCFLGTTIVIAAIALQSHGLINGRAGMIALCQMSFAGVGAWATGYFSLWGIPGGLPVWILLGGLSAVPLGMVIGVPALRLRGIRFAIVTLSFAIAVSIALAVFTFPGQAQNISVVRPEIIDSDRGYFLFVALVYAILAIAQEMLGATRFGAALVALHHSERATASHGINVPFAKVYAFAASAFVAAMAGGLLAGHLGTLVPDNFDVMQSLVFFSIAVMVGSRYPEGAIVGGALVTLIPEGLRRLQIPQDFGDIAFALGAIQSMATRTSIGAKLNEAVKDRLRGKRGQLGGRLDRRPSKCGHRVALAVDSLTVRYGNVLALNHVSFEVPAGSVVGLIGPNGAGKSTLIDAISGFLNAYEGRISVAGRPVDKLSAHLRARGLIRRTWQTNRIAPDMSLGDYMRLAAPDLTERDIQSLIGWFGCPDADAGVGSLDAGTRRLLDVAGVIGAEPTVVLLDEPAAGQSLEDSRNLGSKIKEMPSQFGVSVLLVEHDMDLVRAVCSHVVVLDFGRLVAQGDTHVVLESNEVKKAYLGTVQVGLGA